MPRRNASSSTSRASVKTEDSPQGSTPSRGSANNQLCSIGLRVLCHLSLHSLFVPKPVEPSNKEAANQFKMGRESATTVASLDTSWQNVLRTRMQQIQFVPPRHQWSRVLCPELHVEAVSLEENKRNLSKALDELASTISTRKKLKLPTMSYLVSF